MFLKRFVNDAQSDSFLNRMRNKRFELFNQLTNQMPRPLRILDVGGTARFWENRGCSGCEDFHITLVNLTAEASSHSNIESVQGDATDLSEYADNSFDIVFSNSVIEHLFTIEKQQAMAREVRRVGKAYWVQTPNYWFPMEPHFLVPGWQWLPLEMRIAIIRRHGCGQRGRCPDPERARRIVEEVRLLRRRELAELFPDAILWPERMFGMVKSWVAYAGFYSSHSPH